MKKLIFVFTLMFGVLFASCGNSVNSANSDKDSVDTIHADTALVDTTECVD